MFYDYSCSKCGQTVVCEVDVAEHLVDDPGCICGYEQTEKEKMDVYSKALADATGTAIDYAQDYLSER